VASGEESSLISVFRQPDTAWFSVLYSFTFGGFVGLTSFLTLFFHDRYHLQKVRAADFTTLVVISGSFLRPVGGWLADRIGGYRLLLALLTGVGGLLFAISSLPEFSVVVPLVFLSMGMLRHGQRRGFSACAATLLEAHRSDHRRGERSRGPGRILASLGSRRDQRSDGSTESVSSSLPVGSLSSP